MKLLGLVIFKQRSLESKLERINTTWEEAARNMLQSGIEIGKSISQNEARSTGLGDGSPPDLERIMRENGPCARLSRFLYQLGPHQNRSPQLRGRFGAENATGPGKDRTDALECRYDGTSVMSERSIDDILAGEILDLGINIQCRAVGPSMRPLITAGDRLLVKPGPAAGFKPGDIVLYVKDGHYIVHRVVQKAGPEMLITRGDALGWNDPPVPVGSIRGRVVQIEGRGRKIRLTGRTCCLFGQATAWVARRRLRGKRFLLRYLGRLCWLVEGRRIR
jgi:hypothetical protein